MEFEISCASGNVPQDVEVRNGGSDGIQYYQVINTIDDLIKFIRSHGDKVIITTWESDEVDMKIYDGYVE